MPGHLRVERLDERRLLINPACLGLSALRGYHTMPVPEDEPRAANLLRVNGPVCVQASRVRTADMLCKWGFDVRTIDLSEFAKAEGGVTCWSLLLSPR